MLYSEGSPILPKEAPAKYCQFVDYDFKERLCITLCTFLCVYVLLSQQEFESRVKRECVFLSAYTCVTVTCFIFSLFLFLR